MGGQPFGRDGPAAYRACSVAVGFETGQGLVEGLDVGLGLVQQVDHQGPFKPDRRALRIMLVIGWRERRGLDDGLQVAP